MEFIIGHDEETQRIDCNCQNATKALLRHQVWNRSRICIQSIHKRVGESVGDVMHYSRAPFLPPWVSSIIIRLYLLQIYLRTRTARIDCRCNNTYDMKNSSMLLCIIWEKSSNVCCLFTLISKPTRIDWINSPREREKFFYKDSIFLKLKRNNINCWQSVLQCINLYRL